MAWPAVVAAGVAAAGATGNGVLSYYTDKNLHRQAQADTQKNMVLASHLEQQSIRNYTSNLRAAGLNPALATGAQPVTVGSPASPAVAGSGKFDYSSVAPAFLEGLGKKAEIENTESATEVNEANAQKLEEETREKKIQNDREESRDRIISEQVDNYLNEMKDRTDDPFIRGLIESVQRGEGIRDVGALHGFCDLFFDFSQRERDRELDYIAKEMDKEVLRRQFEEDTLTALAKRPYDERIALYKRVALMNMQIYSLAADASLTENKRELIQKQVEHLEQEVQSMYHRDPAAMYQAGDTSALVVGASYEAIVRAADGFGFGTGAALASRLGGRAPGAMKTRLDVGEARAARQTEVFRQAMKKGEQPKQLEVARLRKELEQMKSNEKYFKPEVYRKKLDELMRVKYGI